MHKPPREKERLARLRALNLLDPGLNDSLLATVTFAAQISECPTAYLSFIESDRQIIRSQVGLALSEIPRDRSICSDTILSDEPLLLNNIQDDPRYRSSALREEPHSFSFYAGFPLITKDGLIIGTLVTLDTQPHTLTTAQIKTLQNLAHHIIAQFELNNKLAAVQRTISSLEDSEQRFRRIADASPVLLWISDEAGNRTLSNKAWCDFTGLSQEESLAECWRKTVHPDDRDVYQAKWRECASSGNRFQHEFRLCHTSGNYRWVMEQAIPLFGSNGKPEAYVSSCVDLSLRNSDELQYQHNEARFRAISEAAPLGIVVTDSNGNCIYSNHQFQRLSSLSTDESLGSGWLRTVHPDDREQIQSAWFEATQSSKSFERSFRYQHPDGTITWCNLKAAAINSTDTVSGWVSTLEDITEKRKSDAELIAAKQAAEAAMHAKSQFLANMSHEIRTPLTAIIGFTEALRDEWEYDPTQMHCLDVIRNNGKHLLEIINQILDLSKIDAGALTIESSPCNIVDLIEELRFMFAPTVTEKSLTLSINYSWPLPRVVSTDPLRLKQVLINLLGNAIKFTSQGSIELSVTWEESSQQLLFEVTDSGIGMTPEQATGLFKPFCQANESITRQFGGTGLGLSISERLVRALGGAIEVSSELGQGSVFSFSIHAPAPSDNTILRRSPSDEASSPANAKAIPHAFAGNVLFADDALDNRRLVEHFIKKVGLNVVLVENGLEACEAVKAQPFDLILMDVQMPVMDGLTATRSIRQNGVNVPIIAISAGAMTSDISKAIEAGCSTHLSKPFSRESLYETLARYLEKSGGQGASIPSNPLVSSLIGGDPDMIELLVDFIDGLQQRFSDISSAYSAKDFAKLSTLAHKLKGSAGMYGLPELASMAGNLEKTAKAFDCERAQALVQSIGDLLPRIQRGRPTAVVSQPSGS
jgi:PAS domain S-box-containing protein